MKETARLQGSIPGGGGFSLVEILVALVIGLVSTIAVMQILALFEAQKRTITAVADAETNGAFALYSLQRDIRASGYAVSALNLLGCAVTLRSGVTLNAMAPVAINHTNVPAGDADTDTLLVIFGNGDGAAEGDGILPSSNEGALYQVQTPTSFREGDRVIALPRIRPNNCSLVLGTVDDITAKGVNVIGWVDNMSLGTLFNLGPAPIIRGYAVRAGRLTVCDFMANNCADANTTGNTAIWVPIASNIVSLRAQYGRDTNDPMDARVDLYDQAIASPVTTPSVPLVQCGWARVFAVRIAVVARSGHYERPRTDEDGNLLHATTAAPSWSGNETHPIDLSARTDWRDYRYKTFETVVPIRNVVCSGVRSGC